MEEKKLERLYFSCPFESKDLFGCPALYIGAEYNLEQTIGDILKTQTVIHVVNVRKQFKHCKTEYQAADLVHQVVNSIIHHIKQHCHIPMLIVENWGDIWAPACAIGLYMKIGHLTYERALYQVQLQSTLFRETEDRILHFGIPASLAIGGLKLFPYRSSQNMTTLQVKQYQQPLSLPYRTPQSRSAFFNSSLRLLGNPHAKDWQAYCAYYGAYIREPFSWTQQDSRRALAGIDGSFQLSLKDPETVATRTLAKDIGWVESNPFITDVILINGNSILFCIRGTWSYVFPYHHHYFLLICNRFANIQPRLPQGNITLQRYVFSPPQIQIRASPPVCVDYPVLIDYDHFHHKWTLSRLYEDNLTYVFDPIDVTFEADGIYRLITHTGLMMGSLVRLYCTHQGCLPPDPLAKFHGLQRGHFFALAKLKSKCYVNSRGTPLAVENEGRGLTMLVRRSASEANCQFHYSAKSGLYLLVTKNVAPNEELIVF